jgi:VanZ family protein
VLKKLALVGAVGWTLLIFILCVVKSTELPVIAIANLDKVVHAFFHFVFVILWFLYFKEEVKSSYSTKAFVFAFALSVFYGIVIEVIQQIFTTTRAADVLDVVANLVGALVAVVVIIVTKNVVFKK